MKHLAPLSRPRPSVARADAGISNYAAFKNFTATLPNQIARVVIVTKYGETLPS